MGNYHTATSDFLRVNSAPKCPNCGAEMAAEDDHGRFRCLSCWGGHDVVTGLSMPRPRAIRQVNTAGMSDAEKAKIPPINRVHSDSTAAEARLLELMLKGPAAMDDPAYSDALRAVNAERDGGVHG